MNDMIAEVAVSRLVSADIISPTNQRLSLMGQIANIDIYENIESSFLYAMFIINDGVNLLDQLPIIGEERIELVVDYTGSNVDNETYQYEFAVTSVESMTSMPQGTAQVYALHCHSIESVKDNSMLVTKIYNKTTVDTVLEDIIKRQLNTKKQLTIEPTKGIFDFCAPGVHPSNAIEMCRNSATSSENASSTYYFYETRKGFFFRTLEGMFWDTSSATFTYKFSTDPNFEQGSDKFILDYENSTRSDRRLLFNAGALASQVTTFDIFTKKKTVTQHKLGSDIDKVFLNKKLPDQSHSITQQYIEQYGNTPSVKYMVVVDGSQPDAYYDVTLPLKNMYNALNNSMVVTILVPGNFDVCAGDLVTLNYPQMDGLTGPDKKDNYLSGEYIITAARHMFVMGAQFKHHTSLRLVKGSF